MNDTHILRRPVARVVGVAMAVAGGVATFAVATSAATEDRSDRTAVVVEDGRWTDEELAAIDEIEDPAPVNGRIEVTSTDGELTGWVDDVSRSLLDGGELPVLDLGTRHEMWGLPLYDAPDGRQIGWAIHGLGAFTYEQVADVEALDAQMARLLAAQASVSEDDLQAVLDDLDG